MNSNLSPIVEHCIQVIQTVHSTHALTVAAAKLIVADAEWNYRFHDRKEGGASDQLLHALDDYERIAQSLSATYAKFEANPTMTGVLLDELLAAQEHLSRLP